MPNEKRAICVMQGKIVVNKPRVRGTKTADGVRPVGLAGDASVECKQGHVDQRSTLRRGAGEHDDRW